LVVLDQQQQLCLLHFLPQMLGPGGYGPFHAKLAALVNEAMGISKDRNY
jgi:hypothetical protein